MQLVSIGAFAPLNVDIPPGQTRKDVLGGKADSLCVMRELGLNVPPAVVIPVQACRDFLALKPDARSDYLDELMKDLWPYLGAMDADLGFGPLLSIRSGAAISMPGMMDTILNVGMCDLALGEWMSRIGERAALDSYRRAIQMLGSTAYGIDPKHFEERLDVVKSEAGVESDSALDADALREALKLYKACFKAYAFKPFPQDPAEQIRAGIAAVFTSWMNPRAIEYRKINGISDDLGTAVTIQAMVFGNMGETSATGVLFSRNPSTGEPGMVGEFLINAQGEDVVAGIRTPVDIEEMRVTDLALWNAIYAELKGLCATLEHAYRDMVDIEFTVQEGKLYVLQCRAGKRSALAAFRIARDAFEEEAIDFETVCSRITRAQYRIATRPALDPEFKGKPVATGLPACPGVVTGRIVRSAKEAVEATDPVILVTHETDPDDIAGMAAAVGILTATGGATSHAAVVARAMDKPCVVGCTGLALQGKLVSFDGVQVAGTTLSICGATGRVWVGKVPVVDGSESEDLLWFKERAQAHNGVVGIGPVPGYARISALEWWGQEIVGQAILTELAALPSRAGVVLDLRAPVDLMPPEDLDLVSAAGMGTLDADGARFANDLVGAMLQIGEGLTGLCVIGVTRETDRKGLRAKGIGCVTSAVTIADLMRDEPVEVSAAFISDVVGGNDAFGKLVVALKAAGITVRGLPVAEPVDYTALALLAQ